LRAAPREGLGVEDFAAFGAGRPFRPRCGRTPHRRLPRRQFACPALPAWLSSFVSRPISRAPSRSSRARAPGSQN